MGILYKPIEKAETGIKSPIERAEIGDILYAKEIIEDPGLIDQISGNYQILRDSAVFNSLNKAINIMGAKSWRCVSFTIEKRNGYALMERKS